MEYDRKPSCTREKKSQQNYVLLLIAHRYAFGGGVLPLIAKLFCRSVLSLIPVAVISDYFNFPEVSL
jgi:hypothetical protein